MNPGYVLLLGAAAGVLSLVFPWVVLAGQPPYLPVGVASSPAVPVHGWQLAGISILVVSIGIAVGGYLFVRGRAGLVTKLLVVAGALVYGRTPTVLWKQSHDS